jgi:CRP/FNR family cyclic AMP-dependent transcriptional regulator
MALATHRSSRIDLQAAVSRSFLRGLDGDRIGGILRESVLHHVGAGRIFAAEDEEWVGIVISGLIRVFLWAPSGRRLPLHLVRAGGVVGIGALAGTRDASSAEAVHDAHVLELNGAHVRGLASGDHLLANAIAAELGSQLERAFDSVRVNGHGTVRERLAWHLLEMACDPHRPDHPPEVIHASHESLADAVGSAREVITRTLADLRRQGLVAIDRGCITITCAARLRDLAAGVGERRLPDAVTAV